MPFELSSATIEPSKNDGKNQPHIQKLYNDLVFGIDLSELLIVFYNTCRLELCDVEHGLNNFLITVLNSTILHIKTCELESSEEKIPSKETIHQWIVEAAHSLGICREMSTAESLLNFFTENCSVQKHNPRHAIGSNMAKNISSTEQTPDIGEDRLVVSEAVIDSFLTKMEDGELLRCIESFVIHICTNSADQLSPDLTYLDNEHTKLILEWLNINRICIPGPRHIIYDVFVSFLTTICKHLGIIYVYSQSINKVEWVQHTPEDHIVASAKYVIQFNHNPVAAFMQFLEKYFEEIPVSDLATSLKEHPLIMKRCFNLPYNLNWTEIGINFATYARESLLTSFVVHFSTLLTE